MEIADERHVVISTRAGTDRARVVRLSDGRLGLWVTGDLAAIDGETATVIAERPGAAELHGTARVVRSGRAFDEAAARLRKKYGWRARVSHPDSVVLLRLESPE